MATYIPTAIDEKAFEQAQRDALATYAPKGAVMGSGFLAGLVATWLPGVIIMPLLYLYSLAFGSSAWMSGAEKQAAALSSLSKNLSAYSSVAIWLGLALGLYGILQAVLRQRACITNRFTTFEMARYGEVRMGLDAKLTIFGFPVFAIIALSATNQTSVLFVALVVIVCSGFLYNILWQKLDNTFLRVFFRPDFAQQSAMALRLMVPRHCGWKKVKIDNIEVDQSAKSIRIEGDFETDLDEKEARSVVTHFMRGYHPIYLVNKRKAAS